MSRFVEWGGKLWEKCLFDPPPNPPPGVCPHCGGMGAVFEQIDEERFDVLVPCHHCRMYCKSCKDWVKRDNHTCKVQEKKP